MDPRFFPLWERVKPYTMTGIERGYALFTAVCHILTRQIPGVFVECGVWKGGSALLMALTQLAIIKEREDLRQIHLFDTFEGMPKPGEEDRILHSGEKVLDRWEKRNFDHWAVGKEEVASLLYGSGFPRELITLVPGKVEDTLPSYCFSGGLSLIRLDTDWYASTLTEMRELYPRLVKGGIVIIDDYGHFAGARKAVDEYMASLSRPPYLNRVDYTGRVGVKE
jgi:O-methyltransferase